MYFAVVVSGAYEGESRGLCNNRIFLNKSGLRHFSSPSSAGNLAA